MYWSGKKIIESGIVKNFGDRALQPSSIDVRLSDDFKIYRNIVRNPPRLQLLKIEEKNDYSSFKADKICLLNKHENVNDVKRALKLNGLKNYKLVKGLLLGSTIEWFDIPKECVGFYTGRSSVGRLGVMSHITAGLLDNGWSGRITLEMACVDNPVLLHAGMRIGQVSIAGVEGELTTYNGKYQNQKGCEISKMYEDDDNFSIERKIIFKYREGYSIKEISNDLNVNKEEIVEVLSKAGYNIISDVLKEMTGD